MSDHFGRLFTLRLMVVASMLATPLLYFWRTELALFFGLLFVVYYCYGTQLSVYTALAGDFWGIKFLSTNYGLLLLAWGFAGVLGPLIGSRVFVATGSYEDAFIGAAVVAAAALTLLATVSPPQVPEPAPVR
jgi:OFA family oxalate/formate antiporter-like MFS transporter